MIKYDQISPAQQLSLYVDSYVFVTGDKHLAKMITPEIGTTLVFDFHRTSLMKGQRFKVALIGLHDSQFPLESVEPANDTLMVEFSPYGLTKLTGISSDLIFNRIVDAEEFFGQGINMLYERLKYATRRRQRIDCVEQFLLDKLQTPSSSDMIIFELAEKIRAEPYLFSFADLKKTTPLSLRQIERKFKELSGTNIQTYLRIARFEKAKSLLENGQLARLTDIGYEAGYYDQSHFSTEFKKLSGTAPKSYASC